MQKDKVRSIYRGDHASFSQLSGRPHLVFDGKTDHRIGFSPLLGKNIMILVNPDLVHWVVFDRAVAVIMELYFS